MKNLFKYLIIFLSSMTLFACGSSGGGGDDDDSVTPSLPADATTITTANASTVSRSAVDNVVLFVDVGDLLQKTEVSPSTSEILKLFMDQAFSNDLRSRSLALRSDTEACDSGGSITVDYDETATSQFGTYSFDDCGLFGVTIDGGFDFNSEFDDISGDFTDTANGSLTITSGGETAVIALDYEETGNEILDTFSITMSISVSGVPGENYLLSTIVPITGIGDDVTGGQILVEGAGGTRLRITVTTPDMADVELDDGSGTFVPHSSITF